MQTNHHAAATVPPHARLIQMATGYWISRMLYAAAALGLADQLAAGPASAAELAAQTHAHERSLHRLLRGLTAVGVVSEVEGGRFALAPLGEALKTGAPGSARATILALAGDFWWRGWSQFLYCVRTGNTAMEKEFGMTIFDYLAQHPDEASYFNEAMVGFHGDEPDAVAAAYDFSGCRTVVDVGGGTGNLLTAILRRYPGACGVLGDRPHVIREARALIGTNGLADRLAFADVDFF